MITIYDTTTCEPFTTVETVHEAQDLLSHIDNLMYCDHDVEPNDCANYIESLNRGWQ